MGKLIDIFKSILRSNNSKENIPESPDTGEIIGEVKKAEKENRIEPGRRIHQMSYCGLDLRLDMDITETYRITVSHGQERIYSFSVYSDRNDYDSLRKAYDRILDFLKGEQALANLPDNELIKGRFFGYPE